MNRARLLTMILVIAFSETVSVADESNVSANRLNTEPSIASLHIQVDEILAERESAISQFGPRHPQVLALDTKLSIAQESLSRLKRRKQQYESTTSPQPTNMIPSQSDANQVMIRLQQMVLELTNRVTSLEAEVRELKMRVQRLPKP